MQTERRIAKCAVLVALVLLGGACTKIDDVTFVIPEDDYCK